ncbi:hypothetical protein B0H14DRAFT_3514745 [Mycena olivaceomarginata]|nr:hypothetical protein B0H14DRAFT_3514745 [Mycena olivaceomarginata]
MNGAEFSAGENVEKPEMEEQRLREEAEIFGLWNPETTASTLGFGSENAEDGQEEEENNWWKGEARSRGALVRFDHMIDVMQRVNWASKKDSEYLESSDDG